MSDQTWPKFIALVVAACLILIIGISWGFRSGPPIPGAGDIVLTAVMVLLISLFIGLILLWNAKR